MDPASNIVGLLPQGTARDILAYYTQCMAPVGPLDTYINITTVAMKSLNYTVTKSVTSFANASHVSKSTSLQCIGSLVNPVSFMETHELIRTICTVNCQTKHALVLLTIISICFRFHTTDRQHE